MAIFTKEKTYNILDLGFNRLLIKPSSEDSFITPEMVNAWRSGVAAKSLLSGQIISTLEQQTGVLFNGKTDFSNTDSGYRLGIDTDLVLKFYIGDSSNFFNWTGSALDISGAFSAGSIDIGGSDASSFHVNSDGNMWLGAATFASAVFRVSNAGAVTATSLTLTNAAIGTGSSYTGNAIADAYIDTLSANKIVAGTGIINDLNIKSLLIMGDGTTYGTIRTYDYDFKAVGFKIADGVTPTIETKGGSITGGTITGGTIQTGTSGERIVMASNTLKSYDTSGVLRAQLGPVGYRFFAADATTVGSAYGTMVGATPTLNFLIGAHGFTLDATGDLAGVSGVAGNWIPNAAGTLNLGDATNYWNDVSYKTLTDRGCLFDADDGVELQDGRIVSDVEAIKAIKKHPTKLSVHGLAALDYKTFPKKLYKPADKDGEILPRDKDDIPYWYEEVEDEKTKEIKKVKRIAADGVETTGVISILLGAIKELSNRIDFLEKKLT